MTAHRITTSDGVGIHVEDHGEGRVMVFVGGYAVSLASWHDQVAAALAAGYRTVAIDRRWHGASDRPAHGQRIARHAADVREVVSALGLGRPLLVGASMGASVCWSYLDLFGPADVAGMIAVDQTPRMVNDADWPHGFYGLTEDNLGRFFAHGVPPTGRGRAHEHREEATAALAARAGVEALDAPILADTRALLDDHARADWRDVCRNAPVPMLLVAARESQLWPCDHAAAATAGNPQARALVIEECGHAVQIERPNALNAAILDFAATLPC